MTYLSLKGQHKVKNTCLFDRITDLTLNIKVVLIYNISICPYDKTKFICIYAHMQIPFICRYISLLFVPLLLVLNKGNISEKVTTNFKLPKFA